MEKEYMQKLEAFKMDDALGHVVNRAAIVIRKQLTLLFKEAGFSITPEEFSIISRLWEEDGLLQSEITEKTLKDKTRVTRLLSGLIEQSYVEKRVLEEDRRNYRIYLTEKGQDLKYKLLPIVIGLMGTASANISLQDMDTTIKTLKAVFVNVNKAFSEKDGM